jgi:hypothetical protein
MNKERRKGNCPTHQDWLYIPFVYRPWTSPHAPMYHTNLILWSYPPPAPLFINRTTTYYPTSQNLIYFLIVLNYTATITLLPPHLPTSLPFHNPIPSTPFLDFRPLFQVSLYHPVPWEYPPLRFEVLREHWLMVLASVGIADGTLPLPVSHPQLSEVPKSKNHMQSTISDTLTDSSIPDYPQHRTLDTLPLYQPLPTEGATHVVRP